MHNSDAERTIAEARPLLMEAAAHLAPHNAKVLSAAAAWLRPYPECSRHRGELTAMRLDQRLRRIQPSKVSEYCRRAERSGFDLSRRGVPAQCAALAVLAYAESCFSYLIDAPRAALLRSALMRWALAYQFLLLSGYTRYISQVREECEKRVATAERRSQDFLVEVGDAVEEERRRMAQDLHDVIGHDLIVLKLYTQMVALDLKKGDARQLRGKLRESISLINHALKSVRHLVFDLGPAVWSKQGFLPAVRLYTRQFAARTGLKVSFSARGLKTKLPARYETPIYKLLQGALSNVAAHADAHRVNINMRARRDRMEMIIEDDGKGFDVRRKVPHAFGLRAMSDRVELLGGSIEFMSRPSRRNRPGGGTRIELHLPLHKVEKA